MSIESLIRWFRAGFRQGRNWRYARAEKRRQRREQQREQQQLLEQLKLKQVKPVRLPYLHLYHAWDGKYIYWKVRIVNPHEPATSRHRWQLLYSCRDWYEARNFIHHYIKGFC